MNIHEEESLWCQRIEKKLDETLEFINGNGKPGAKERIGRLELIAGVLVAAVGIIFTAVVNLLIRGHG